MVAKSFALSLALAGILAAQSVPTPTQVGRRSPELVITLTNGRQLLLSQFSGKVVALAFIHTTCPHCQAATKVLAQMENEFGARGFQVLEVAFNDGAAMLLPDFIKENRVNFPVGVGTSQDLYAYLDSPPKATMLPQLFLIDRKGVIRGYYPGNDPLFQNAEVNLRAEIEKLLGSPLGQTHSKRILKPAQ